MPYQSVIRCLRRLKHTLSPKPIHLSEELLQTLGAHPFSIARLSILAALCHLETGDLRAVFFFAHRFSDHDMGLLEVAEALVWLRGHRYTQAEPHWRRDFFWQRPGK